MANGNFCNIRLDESPIEARAAEPADGEGAVCEFLGLVRGEEDGRRIRGIQYTAYRPMADQELGKLCERALREHGPHRIEIQHRLGFVAEREASILLRVTTKHSAAAFDLCRWYLKEIKTTVPIWKKPDFNAT